MAMATRRPCDDTYIGPSGRAEPCEPDRGGWVLLATILGSSMAFIDGTVVNVALPVLQNELHATVAQVQWVVEAYTLLLSALLLTGGALGDQFGRRRVYAIGVTLFAAASLWCGLAPTAGQLIAARALQGVGAALLVPGSLAIISAYFDDSRRGRAIGTWSALTSITFALGPVVGGWLVEHFTWRAAFFVNLPLALVVLPVTFLRMPESRNPEAGARVDVAGTVLATLGLGGLVYGLVESSNLGLGHPLVIGTVVAGALLLGLFVVVEARSPAPMMPLGVFRSRTFSGANLLTLLLYAALTVQGFFLPFNLIQLQGYTPAQAGLAVLPFPVLLFLLSRWTGGLADRLGARVLLLIGPLVTGAGFALLALPAIGGSYWTTFFPPIVIMGLGMAITVAPLTTAVMGAVDAERAGVASGINNAVSRVGGLVAIAVLGIVAVSIFGASLNARLAQMPVPPAARQALMAQSTRLAAAEPPAGLDSAQHQAMQDAIRQSYLGVFRVMMLLCAAAAVASALCAWFLVEGRRAPPAGGRREG
jgi:EmrB/QacA subfamily drug resistance transporter